MVEVKGRGGRVTKGEVEEEEEEGVVEGRKGQVEEREKKVEVKGVKRPPRAKRNWEGKGLRRQKERGCKLEEKKKGEVCAPPKSG